MTELLDYAKRYLNLGLSVIPLKPKDKKPDLSRWQQYQKRQAGEKELESWFNGTDKNVGIICGKVSGNLVVADFDDERAFRYCFSRGDGLPAHTLCVRTGKGLHVYLRLQEATKCTTLKAVKSDGGKPKASLPLDIKGEGGYVVAPPSIHPITKTAYAFIGEAKDIMALDPDGWVRFNEQMRERAEEWPIVDKLLPAWNQGNRQNLAMGVAGLFRKLGFEEDRVKRILEGICEATGDVEVVQRTSAVHATFSKDSDDDVATIKWLGEDLYSELKKVAPARRRQRADKPTSEPKGTEEVLDLSGTEYVIWTPGEARLGKRTNMGDGDSRLVIIKPPRPLRRLVIDEDTFYEVEDDGKIKTLTVTDLYKELAEQGRIIFRSRAMDVLSVIISRMTTETYEGHATFGCYSEAGKLVVCEKPHPMRAEQKKVHRQIQARIPFVPGQDDMKAYATFLEFFHPHQILHKLGLALIIPFNPVIKVAGILVPAELSIGPHDTGKTKSSEAVSVKMYGISSISGVSISTEFRLLSQLDCANLPRSISEAEKVDPKLWPLYKDACESYLAGQRGTKVLDMWDYNSRMGPMHSANDSPIVGLDEILKRFWVTVYTEEDRKRRANPAKTQAFKEAFRKLQPIGYQLLRWWVEAHPTEEDLLSTVYKLEMLINDEYERRGLTWMSPQRAQGWAGAYLGLQIFELGCSKTGVDWHVPTIEWFVENVVSVTEESTWSRSRSNVSLFASWLAMFKAKNRRPIRGRETILDERGRATTTSDIEYVVTGEDELWCTGSVSVEGRGAVAGTWVTTAMVDQYNKENREGHKFSLSDLAKEAADKAGIPYALVMEKEEGRKSWRPKSVRIGEQTGRAAFIPACLDDGWQVQTKKEEFDDKEQDEWSGCTLSESVTQCHPMSPTRVTEENNNLDSISKEQRHPVTQESRAYMRAQVRACAHEGVEKSGVLGDKGSFSGIWPAVTQLGDNGLQWVTRREGQP